MPVREDVLSALCGREVAHVVLLLPVGKSAPPPVEAAISVHGRGSLQFSQPLEAFAELALQDRLESTRSAWGLSTAGIACLLVADALPQWDLHAMEGAAARYLPGVAIVEFDGSRSAPWRVVTQAIDSNQSPHPFRRAQSSGADAPAAPRAASFPPALRLVDQEGNGSHFAFPGDQRDNSAQGPAAPFDLRSAEENSVDCDSLIDEIDEDPAPSVTREEIAMLLGDDQQCEDGPGGAGRGAAR